MDTKKIPVVVTTSHRGVFFGYVDKLEIPANETIELEQARMAVYWPKENHGVIGLGADGPKPGARIGPPAPRLVINHVDAIIECTDKAVKKWNENIWT